MNDVDRDAVSDRAYALWEEEGRPEGKAAQVHWAQASRELDGTDTKENAGAVQSLDPASDPIEQMDGPDKIPLYP